MALLLIVLVVILRGRISAGYVGVALLNVILFSQSIKMLVMFWTTLETHIGAVARVKIFSETVDIEDKDTENTMPPAIWPSPGGIEFDSVSAAYKYVHSIITPNPSLTVSVPGLLKWSLKMCPCLYSPAKRLGYAGGLEGKWIFQDNATLEDNGF
jgi:ABC-type multidrug transport system fused ATPase/permease subunit